MTIAIFNADTVDYEIKIDGLDSYEDLGIVIKLARAIENYYEKQEFKETKEKLGGLYETQKES